MSTDVTPDVSPDATSPRRFRLRRWQKDAIEQLRAVPAYDHLVEVTPGGGKTIFAITAMLLHLRRFPHRRVFVVCPSRSLKRQWADVAAGFGLQLEPSWDGGAIPPDAHGVALTYAQVGSSAGQVAAVAGDAAVILDEVHHAGEARSWGEGLRTAFGDAGWRLALSGTPWRNDEPIPFVRYDSDGVAQPDYRYGYSDALRDGGVVRPVFFPRVGGEMEWVDTGGRHRLATFTDHLDREGMSQRLRTALSASGGWLPDVLRQVDEQLGRLRTTVPDAAALVFAMDQEHAREVAGVLRAVTGHDPVLVLSDEPGSHAAAETFKTSTAPYAVCVGMLSEGYDCARMAVAVYATNVVQPLFFAQAVGRVLRWRSGQGNRQAAWFFIPDDPRLRALAVGMREQRIHGLRTRSEGEEERPPREPADAEQMSLVAAVASSASQVAGGEADLWTAPVGAGSSDDPDLDIELPPAPPARPGGTTAGGATFARREALRKANHERAKLLARHTGKGHHEINKVLNQAAGVTRVAQATVAQLERRLREADRWLTQGTG